MPTRKHKFVTMSCELIVDDEFARGCVHMPIRVRLPIDIVNSLEDENASDLGFDEAMDTASAALEKKMVKLRKKLVANEWHIV